MIVGFRPATWATRTGDRTKYVGKLITNTLKVKVRLC